MKLAVLGDLQIVSPTEPMEEIRVKRRHFAEAWPSFQHIVKKVREQSPDLVVCVGDLVDWYSVHNRDFVLELMDQLKTPWVATPGNHDYSFYEWNDDKQGLDHVSSGERWEEADRGWKESGVTLDNRVIDTGGTRLILMNSAFSDVLPGTREWLRQAIVPGRPHMLFTHVPIDTVEVRDYIRSIDPKRQMAKYVQSHAPWLFEECIEGNVQHVYSGHLHLPGLVNVKGTAMHLLGLSTVSVDRFYPGMGDVSFVQVS
ncbi:MAG: metallophosphoesterase [Paenibacillus sp.]|jgi:3',5'-cyclic AMP phosphodiesterase CpdA|nr:metallophosphoesterase [Paenibacillus sp.]